MERATNCKDLVDTLHTNTHPDVKHYLGTKKAKPVMLATHDQKWETQSIVTLVYTLLLQGIPFDSFQRLFYAVQLGLCDSDKLECKKSSPSVPPSVFDTIEKSGLVRFLKTLGNLSSTLLNRITNDQRKGVNKIHLSRYVGEALIELIIVTRNFKTEESTCCGSLDNVAGTLERGMEENKLCFNAKFIERLRFRDTNTSRREEGRIPIFCLTHTNNPADLSEIMTCLSHHMVSEESVVQPSNADNSEDAANSGPRRSRRPQKKKPPPSSKLDHQKEKDETISDNQQGLAASKRQRIAPASHQDADQQDEEDDSADDADIVVNDNAGSVDDDQQGQHQDEIDMASGEAPSRLGH
jgi:hypothetical protein